MNLLSEMFKFDGALAYQALTTPAPGVRSRYFKMGDFGKLVFGFMVAGLAVGETVVATIIEAINAAGGSAAAIATATCTVTANTLVTIADITMAGGNVGDTVTITANGVTVVFTAAAAENLLTGTWDQSGAPAAEATSLAACINAAFGAALGITATVTGVGTDHVTLTVDEAGATTITVVSSAPARQVPATNIAVGYIEVDATALTAGFDHVALQLVGPATANGCAAVIRGEARALPVVQAVAASDHDPVIV